MEYIYAAMLLHKAGKAINEDSVKKVLEAAGITVDSARVKALVGALENVNIDEAIKKQATLAVATAQPASQSEAKHESKKEEKKEEKKSDEAAAAGLGSLFG